MWGEQSYNGVHKDKMWIFQNFANKILQGHYTDRMAYAKVQFWTVFGQNGEIIKKELGTFFSLLDQLAEKQKNRNFNFCYKNAKNKRAVLGLST